MHTSWLLPLAAFLAVGCVTPAPPAAPATDLELADPFPQAVAFDARVAVGEDRDCLLDQCTRNSPVELYAPPFNASIRAARIDIADAGVGGPVHWRVFCKVQGCGGTLAEGNGTLPVTIDLPALALPMGAALYVAADAPYDVPLSNAAAVLLRSTVANGTAWIAWGPTHLRLVPFEADLNTGLTVIDDDRRYATLPGPLLQDVALVVTWNQTFTTRQILVRVSGEGPDCPPRTECHDIIDVIGDAPLRVDLRGIAFRDARIAVMDQDISPLGAGLGQGLGTAVHLQGNVTVQYVALR